MDSLTWDTVSHTGYIVNPSGAQTITSRKNEINTNVADALVPLVSRASVALVEHVAEWVPCLLRETEF